MWVCMATVAKLLVSRPKGGHWAAPRGSHSGFYRAALFLLGSTL